MPLYRSTTKNGIQKTLAAQLLNTATTGDPISFSDVDGVPNAPGVLVIDRVDSNNVETPNKREYISYSGTSGTTCLIATRNVDGSGTVQTHSAGAIVEWNPDVTWAEAIYTALGNMVNTSTLAVDTTKVVTPTGTQALSNKILASGATVGTYTPVLGSDAAGDMYYRSINGNIARLALGSVGQSLVAGATAPAWGAGGVVSDGGVFVYPTNFESFRAFSTGASLSSVTYADLRHNATDAELLAGAGHVVLTPATSKLVKVAVLRQNSTTDAYQPNSVILTGWSKKTGDNSISMGGTAVTFGITFAAYPIVVASDAASKATSASDPTGTSAQGWQSMELTGLSTTGFTPYYTRNRKADDSSPGGFGSSLDFICTWIAIGVL